MPPRRVTTTQIDIMRTDKGKEKIRAFKSEIEEGFRANCVLESYQTAQSVCMFIVLK